MKVLITLLVLVAGVAPVAFGGIRAPGKYNGVVVFDRWDGCHLYSGVYVMEVSETVKEKLRPYEGRAVLVDAKEVLQPINPGDGLITELEVLGAAEEPDAKKAGSGTPMLDGLVLTAAPNFVAGSNGEFVLTLRNNGPGAREVSMDALGPTLFTRRDSNECLGFMHSPADGPSYTAMTRLSIPFLYEGRPSYCRLGDAEVRVRMLLEPGLVLPQRRMLAVGESVEVPVQVELTAGEYEFMAGYGGGVHASRLLVTKRFGFDVDSTGRGRLVGEAVGANLNRPKGRGETVCGRVEVESATGPAGAKVYLWPYPLDRRQPRAVSYTTADGDGWFRLDGVRGGRYAMTATLQVGPAVFAGALGAEHAADSPALTVPVASGECSLKIQLARQPAYSVAGRTEPGPAGAPARKVQVKMEVGDAYPFEAEALVDPVGRYEFRNLPEGEYQFLAGWAGSGFELKSDIEDLRIDIEWPPEQGTQSTRVSGSASGSALSDDVSFNETMAYFALTEVNGAEKAYADRYGKGFSANLGQLGTPPSWAGPSAEHAGLFDPAHGARGLDVGGLTYSSQGYRISYVPGGRDGAGNIRSYQVSARPIEYGKTGTRGYWMDQTGVIHATKDDRAANGDDPKAELE